MITFNAANLAEWRKPLSDFEKLQLNEAENLIAGMASHGASILDLCDYFGVTDKPAFVEAFGRAFAAGRASLVLGIKQNQLQQAAAKGDLAAYQEIGKLFAGQGSQAVTVIEEEDPTCRGQFSTTINVTRVVKTFDQVKAE